jgi:hypothetical protein
VSRYCTQSGDDKTVGKEDGYNVQVAIWYNEYYVSVEVKRR